VLALRELLAGNRLRGRGLKRRNDEKEIFACPFGFFMAISIAWAATYKVITQEAVIRKDKRFFAPMVTRVPYGDMIEELERQGDWLRVSYKGAQGWLHFSAVQEQKFRLSAFPAKGAQESTKRKSPWLARFHPEVEKAFRDKKFATCAMIW